MSLAEQDRGVACTLNIGGSGGGPGGLEFKAHRLLYHPTLGLRVIKKKKFGRWVPETDLTQMKKDVGVQEYLAHKKTHPPRTLP